MVEDPWLKTAYAYLYIRDFAKALEVFREAIASEPDNPEYYFHASITALRNGEIECAREWAECAVRLAPDEELYAAHLGVVRAQVLVEAGISAARQGELAKAADLFDTALEADPLNEEAERHRALLALSCTRQSNQTTIEEADHG